MSFPGFEKYLSLVEEKNKCENGLEGWDCVLYRHLTAPYGTKLIFWPDGEVTLMESSTHPASGDYVEIENPGIANLNSDYFTEGLEWNEEKEVYVDPADNAVVGRNLQDVILYLIKTVGMDDLKEELQEELKETLDYYGELPKGGKN